MDLDNPAVKKQEIPILQDTCSTPAKTIMVTGIDRTATVNKPACYVTLFGLRGPNQSTSAEGLGKARSFKVNFGFMKTLLTLNQIPAQANHRGISEKTVGTAVMTGKSGAKRIIPPINAGNLLVFGFSRFADDLVGGYLLSHGGAVLSY